MFFHNQIIRKAERNIVIGKYFYSRKFGRLKLSLRYTPRKFQTAKHQFYNFPTPLFHPAHFGKVVKKLFYRTKTSAVILFILSPQGRKNPRARGLRQDTFIKLKDLSCRNPRTTGHFATFLCLLFFDLFNLTLVSPIEIEKTKKAMLGCRKNVACATRGFFHIHISTTPCPRQSWRGFTLCNRKQNHHDCASLALFRTKKKFLHCPAKARLLPDRANFFPDKRFCN